MLLGRQSAVEVAARTEADRGVGGDVDAGDAAVEGVGPCLAVCFDVVGLWVWAVVYDCDDGFLGGGVGEALVDGTGRGQEWEKQGE